MYHTEHASLLTALLSGLGPGAVDVGWSSGTGEPQSGCSGRALKLGGRRHVLALGVSAPRAAAAAPDWRTRQLGFDCSAGFGAHSRPCQRTQLETSSEFLRNCFQCQKGLNFKRVEMLRESYITAGAACPCE